MISVVIPTYNRAGFLGRAIASILAQSYSEIEVIIVDDGSTDKTLEVVDSFNDKRINYYHQKNKGVSSARNLGVRRATGKYVAFLDSDDYWLPQKLELQLSFMRNGGFRISQTQEIWIRKGTRVNPMDKHQKPSGWIFSRSLGLCLISPSCVMLETALFRRGYWFNESFKACEDYDLWLRISLRYPVGLLPRALCVRRGGRPDQLSAKYLGLDLFRIYALLDLEKKPGLDLEKRTDLEDILLKKARIYIKGCLKRGREEEALRIRELLGGRV